MSLLQNAIVGCWVVFIAFWAIAALRTKRTVETQAWRSRLSYAIPIAVGAWLLLKGTSDPQPLGDRSQVSALIPGVL